MIYGRENDFPEGRIQVDKIEFKCYCEGELVRIADIKTIKEYELPNWPQDITDSRTISQCQSCARLYLDRKLLVPWTQFQDEREGCPRCGSRKDLIVDEGRYVCLNPFCCYCWADKSQKRPRKMTMLQDERGKLIENLALLADKPESKEFRESLETLQKIKVQIDNSGREQL